MKFYELAVGARFVFRGKRYEKEAMGMARDERGWGNVLMGEIEVESEGPVLPPEVAARWRPERGHWAAVMNEICGGAGAGAEPEERGFIEH
jgi:hypothetical protein